FQEFHIFAGSERNMHCPGQTTLTMLPSGDFAVHSTFMLHCHIEYLGAPGGALAGLAGMNETHAPMHAGSPFCSADTDLNAIVDVVDLLAVIAAWGDCGPSCDPPTPPCPGDINRDCAVNVSDLLAVIQSWGACK